MGIKKTAHHWGTAALAVALFAGLTACSTADATPTITPDNHGTPVATATATKPAEPESVRGKLVEVLTGDTVVLSPVSDADGTPTGEPNITVNILGMSAPKIDECGGPEAVAEFKRTSNTGGFFRVVFDKNVPRTNAAGQTVGKLVTSDGGGVTGSAALTMTKNGFASAWHEGDVAPENFETMVKNTSIAKSQSAGLWATCDTVGLGSSIPAAVIPTGPLG